MSKCGLRVTGGIVDAIGFPSRNSVFNQRIPRTLENKLLSVSYHGDTTVIMNKGKELFSVRLTPENAEYLRAKGGQYRGRISELINLAIHEMRQGQEVKKPRRKS